jgi:putative tricarboxylic transport membrane protein
LDGLDVVVVAVGLFAVGEALYVAARMRHDTEEIVPVRGRVGMNREEWGRSWKSWPRGTLIGFPFGTLPAGGAEIPTFISYNVEKQLRGHKDQLGQGQ